MPPLPVVSGRKAIKAFAALGWVVDRQRGSHIVLTRQGSMVSLSVPDHGELDRGTLRSLIRTAGLSVEEFVEALYKA